METQDKDVMAKIALVVGSLVLIAVVIFMVVRLLSVINANSIKGEGSDSEAKQALVAERLKPIGTVTVGSASATPANRSGKEIVAATCHSCHGTGVLGAPKIGDNAAWAPRFAQGIPTLLKHATGGFNSMPPRGGDASLSDAEVKKAIIEMLNNSGQNIKVEADAPAAPAAKEETKAEAPAPAAAEPAKAAAADEPAAAVMGDAAPAEKVVDESAKPVAVEGSAAPVSAAANEVGKKIYKSACFSCHDTGVAGAPKVGDSAAWAPRIATGIDSLVHSAINGKGAMPPKGGRLDVSDADIRSTVEYMTSLAQ
ncbi:MAG: c-type cytochrome [bacterium]